MAKGLQSDKAFCEELCNEYFERIYHYCKRLVKGQEQFIDFVEESTQTTFLEARKQISKLRNHPNVEGWLYTTARNLINISYRSMYIKKRHEVIIDVNISSTLIELEELFDSTIDLNKLCIEILRKLNTNEYDLYIAYYKSNMSVSDLLKRYDISATAMTTRIYRLKKKIKNIIRCYFKEKEA